MLSMKIPLLLCVSVDIVPGQLPAVTSGSYFSIDCEDERRCIRLYWQVYTAPSSIIMRQFTFDNNFIRS